MKNNSLKLYVPFLTVIRKRNVHEKESFQVFWSQVHNICRAGFFSTPTFSEHLLPTACEYSMFLPLTKIKIQNIKIILESLLY